jgi:hypothetical protein
MERTSGALLRFVSLIAVVVAFLAAVAVCSAWAQKPCGAGHGLKPCKTAEDTAALVALRADPSFEIGETLADALMHKCSFAEGVVIDSASDRASGLTHVRFQTGDWMLDDIASGDGVREFDLDRQDGPGRYLSDADLAMGRELIVGECFNWSDIRFANGAEKYLTSVRSVIAFHEANDLQENFARVLRPIKGQPDNVFAGYVTECAMRMATVGNVSEHVKVFGALMADPSFPAEGLPRIGFGMLMILYKYNNGLSLDVRDDIMKKLVALTGEADRDRSAMAILVLARLSGDERLQLERYVDRSSSRSMVRSIRARDLQDDSVARLERKLEKIN